MNNIKTVVYEHIRKHDCVTHPELERLFEQYGFDYKGEMADCSEANENVIFWTDWNEEAFMMLYEMINEGLIIREPAPPLVMLKMGKGISCPIVNTDRAQETYYWLPVMFRAVPIARKTC